MILLLLETTADHAHDACSESLAEGAKALSLARLSPWRGGTNGGARREAGPLARRVWLASPAGATGPRYESLGSTGVSSSHRSRRSNAS